MTHSHDLAAHSASRDDARLIQFLNRLAPLEEPIAWIATFRDALTELLGDVDRVSVSVNLQSFDGDRRVAYGHQHPAAVVPIVVPRSPEDDLQARLVAEAERSGFPVEAFHPPSVFLYHAGERVYLASIILWRERTARTISARSLRMMHELRPFITFRMAECIDRFVRDDRTARGAGAMAARIAMRTGLSADEREILALSLGGLSVGAIATRTGLASEAVRRHVAAIHRVTGTFDVGEIIRRFVGETDA